MWLIWRVVVEVGGVEVDGKVMARFVEEVDVALGEGDGDVVFAEEGINFEAEVGLDLSAVEGGAGRYPEVDLEVEGGIAEAHKKNAVVG